MVEALTISYGAAARANAQPIALRSGVPLRLSSGSYAFAEPPDLIRLDTTAARADFLREHLQSLCDLWAKPPRRFLDSYFAWIAATLGAEPARRELTDAGHGLFAPEDWSFSAPRPLPLAFMPVGEQTIRADFAFWTGEGFVAAALPGERRAKRRSELARLAASGATVIELTAADLVDAASLDARLPAPFRAFWRGVKLPRSPFGMRGLTIVSAR